MMADLRKILPELEFQHSMLAPQFLPNDFERCVGVHIRHDDYDDEGKTKGLECFKPSSAEHFMPIMARLAQDHPGLKFYIACPDMNTKVMLAKHFSVDFIHTGVIRNFNGTQGAVADLTNLRNCALCLGSVNSQYTKMVGLLSGKEVVIVSKDQLWLDYGEMHLTTPEAVSDLLGQRLAQLNIHSGTIKVVPGNQPSDQPQFHGH
jgi:hypothetical protein